jgi:ABC-2 type transport system permease protein
MTAALAGEWLRLRRLPTLLVVFGASALVAVLTTVVGIAGATGASSGAESQGPSLPTVAELTSSGGSVAGLASAGELLGAIALVVCAGTLAADYSHGTWRNLLVRKPGRLRLLAGKWLALLGLVGAAGLMATVAAVVAALVVAPSQGIDTADWTTSSGFADMVSAAGNTALAMAGYGTVGAALAILLRTPVAAIGVGLAWLIPGEAILSGAIEGADQWLPGQLLAAVIEGGSDTVAYGTALLTLAAYLLMTATCCAWLFRRRDVTV